MAEGIARVLSERDGASARAPICSKEVPMAIRVEALRIAAELCSETARTIAANKDSWGELFSRAADAAEELRCASIEISTYLGDFDRRDVDFDYMLQDVESDDEIPRRVVWVPAPPSQEPVPEEGGDEFDRVEEAKERIGRAAGIIRAMKLHARDRSDLLHALIDADDDLIEECVSTALSANQSRRALRAKIIRNMREIARLIEIAIA